MKKISFYILLSIILGTSAGCSDWLDVDPIDKTKESTQYSTEEGIQSALNGLYRTMASEALYGGNLTQTAIEAMSNRYFYLETHANTYDIPRRVKNFSLYNYTTSTEVENEFNSVWKNGYEFAFRINNFLRGMNKETSGISKDKKSIFLGEAYGMRAYIHFDLFRIYGPIYSTAAATDKTIPYNNLNLEGKYDEVMATLINLSAENFIKTLLEDIEKAESYLDMVDPVVRDFDTAITNKLEDHFYRNRNRRMNFYAVRALKARVLQYIGKSAEAAAIASEILDLNKFKWVDSPSSGSNYTLFSEVIFGFNNLDFYLKAEKFYQSSDAQRAYLMASTVHKAIFDLDNDNRKDFWKSPGINISSKVPVGVDNVYYMKRYDKSSSDTYPAGDDFQPLIRLPEMLYIIIENEINEGNYETALNMFNTHLERRKVSALYRLKQANNPDIKNDAVDYGKNELMSHMRKEYYREFAGEGQIFFFSKRLNNEDMLNCNTGKFDQLSKTQKDVYVVPIPKQETNY